ncbi:hypothetical protein ACH5RR_015106 [Cinchona calisaya]|uniref:PNPLA domain-containing protein n=1 Tax=Cinchona calisaya TaxID=153742 RepID=A0ABD2ZVS0_9GENT
MKIVKVKYSFKWSSMFKPFSLQLLDEKTSWLAVDGGLLLNNSTANIVTHILHNKRDFSSITAVDDLLVLSLANDPWRSNSREV